MSKSASLDLKVNISELKKNLQIAKQELKLVEAEYKNLSSAAELCSEEHEKLQKQLDANNKLLKAQKTVVDDYKKIIDQTQEKVDKFKQEQDELSEKLSEAKNATEQDEKAISKLEDKLNTCTKNLSTAEKELQKNTKEFHEMSAKVNKTEKSVQDLTKKQQALIKSTEELTDNVDELSDDMGDLSDNVEDSVVATMSAQDAMGVLSDAVGSVKGVVDDLTSSFGNLVLNGINKAIDGIKKFAEYSLGVGIPFEEAVSKYASTMGKSLSDIDVKRAEEKAKELGATTPYTATETMQGMNILAQSGLSTDEQIEAIASVLNLALAGGFGMEESASYITASVKGFSDVMANASKYADLIAKGATLSNTSTQMLGVALSDVSATANAYSQNVDSVTLSLLRLAEQNVVGTDASTALSRAMIDIYTPTKKAKEALKELGVSAYDSKGNARDFNVVCDEISKSLSKMSEEEQNAYKDMIFTVYGLNAFNKMTTASTEKVEEFRNGLAEAGDSAEYMAETMTDNVAGALEELSSVSESFGIEAYEKVKPSIRGVIDSVVGYVGEQVEKLKNGTGLSSAFEAVSGAISRFGEALPGLLEKHTPTLENIFNLTGDIIAQIIDKLPIIIDTLLPKLADLLEKALEILPGMVEELFPKIIDFAEYILTNLPEIIGLLTGLKIGGDLLNFGVKIAEIGLAIKVLFGETLKGALVAAGGSITAIATPVLIVVGVIASLVAILVSAWNHSEAFRKTIERFIRIIKESCLKVIEMITDKFKLFGERLGITSETGEAFLDIIDVIAIVIVDVLGVAIEFIIDIFGGLLEMVLDIIAVFIDLGQIIADVLTGDWDGLKEHFKNLGTDLWSAVTAPFEGIGEFIKGSIEGLGILEVEFEVKEAEEEEEEESGITEKPNRPIVNKNSLEYKYATIGLPQVEDDPLYDDIYLHNPKEYTLQPYLDNNWDFAEQLEIDLNLVKSKFIVFVNNIKIKVDELKQTWEDFKQVFGIIWDAIMLKVDEKKKEINKKIDDIKSKIDDIKDKWEDFKAVFGIIWDALMLNFENKKEEFKKKIDDIKLNFTNLIDEIKQIDLFEIGKKIIQSLIDGLKSKWNELKEKVGDIKSLLGFNSDVTVGSDNSNGSRVVGGGSFGDIGTVGNGSTSNIRAGLNSMNSTISSYSNTNNSNSSTTNNNSDNRTVNVNTTIYSKEALNERQIYKNQNKVLQSALN